MGRPPKEDLVLLQTVDVGTRLIRAYRGIAPQAILDALERAAEPLRGKRVLHVSATPYGGGVSELLRSVVPLMNDLGMVADWKVLTADPAFFQVTKKIHNGLQGADVELTARDREIYLENARLNARAFEERYDFVLVHDPQPAGLLGLVGKGGAKWTWRCHIDTSNPSPDVWAFVREQLVDYDAAVFTMAEFAPPDLPIARVEIMPPAIDPLSPKNMVISEGMAREILAWIGIETTRPLVTQVARFDPWKDPTGVIEAYRLAREEHPNLQLALVGSMALDDPEGWEIYDKLLGESRRDPLIHVFSNLTGVSNMEVNAFQRASEVVVQKSIREGFGLVVTEALWKGTPVVAGRAGGIPLQMADDVGGILVDSVEECARGILTLLDHPRHAADLARRGQERARQRFLLPRLLLDEVMMLASLGVKEGERAPSGAPRDPVCGMTVPHPVAVEERAGQRQVFCSEYCHGRFRLHPERYAAAVER